jgi:hypothetical protein
VRLSIGCSLPPLLFISPSFETSGAPAYLVSEIQRVMHLSLYEDNTMTLSVVVIFTIIFKHTISQQCLLLCSFESHPTGPTRHLLDLHVDSLILATRKHVSAFRPSGSCLLELPPQQEFSCLGIQQSRFSRLMLSSFPATTLRSCIFRDDQMRALCRLPLPWKECKRERTSRG